MNIKNSVKSAVNHVKAHPGPYALAVTAGLIAGAFVYAEKKMTPSLRSMQLVDLNACAAQMRELGNGIYFDLADGSGPLIMSLEEIIGEPITRLS